LVNFGIVPLLFKDQADYEAIEQGDELEIADVTKKIKAGEDLVVINKTKGTKIELTYQLSEREKNILLAGGTLVYIKTKA
jgi:aconitate hydratase